MEAVFYSLAIASLAYACWAIAIKKYDTELTIEQKRLDSYKLGAKLQPPVDVEAAIAKALAPVVTKVKALEQQGEEIKKLADEAKKLSSQTNLAMGFRPLSKKD